MNFPTIAKTTFWDEAEQKETTKIFFVYAGCMSEAVCMIEDWVGKDNITTISLESFEDGIVSVNEEFVETLRKERSF